MIRGSRQRAAEGFMFKSFFHLPCLELFVWKTEDLSEDRTSLTGFSETALIVLFCLCYFPDSGERGAGSQTGNIPRAAGYCVTTAVTAVLKATPPVVMTTAEHGPFSPSALVTTA